MKLQLDLLLVMENITNAQVIAIHVQVARRKTDKNKDFAFCPIPILLVLVDVPRVASVSKDMVQRCAAWITNLHCALFAVLVAIH